MRSRVQVHGRRAAVVLISLVTVAQVLVLGPPPVHADAADPPPLPDPFQVEITPTGFDPSTVDVVVGQSVVFTNHAGEVRQVQATSGMFDSGDIPVGGAFVVAIPDERTVPFVSNGSTTFVGSLRVGPNGFTGPADGLVEDHLPTTTAPLEDPATFAVEPQWGLIASRTTILVAFAHTATVADANRILGAIEGRLAGAIGGTDMVVVNIADRPDGSFDDLTAALATLRADPAIEAAALDTVGEGQSLPPTQPPPAAVAAGFRWAPYSPTGSTSTGAFGLQQSRFPEAWNLLDPMKRQGIQVDIGVADSGFDLTHPEYADVRPSGHHIDAAPVCFGSTCQTIDSTVANQGHGTAVTSLIGGNNVGADPLAHLVLIPALAQETIAGPGKSTLFRSLHAYGALLEQKAPDGLAPNLRVINISLNAAAFARLEDSPSSPPVWALHFSASKCGPGDDDDATGTEPCTPNNEDGYRKEMANIGKLARRFAEEAAAKDVLIVQAAGNDSNKSGNAYFCVPYGAPDCKDAKIEADAKAEFAWAERHLESGAPNNILIVSAIGPKLARDGYSNVGADVSGPGQGTTAAAPGGGYTTFSGTSGATPFVSALAGLVSQYAPALSPEQVRNVIVAHADHDVTDGAAPRIDAYATLTALPNALIDALDMNDPTADGNRRVAYPLRGSGMSKAPDDRLGATVEGQQLRTDGDGVVDMRDFRRYRDAVLQGCEIAASAGCPPSNAIRLDGIDTHPKKDLNLDGCTTDAPCPSESLSPRMDPAGTGGLDLAGEGQIGSDPDGSPSADNLAVDDMTLFRANWGDRRPGGAQGDKEGWSSDDLPSLIASGDIEVHPDALFSLGATEVTITPETSADGGKTWKDVGKARTVTFDQLHDGVAVFTIPAAPTATGSYVRIGMSATIDGKTVTSTKPKGFLHVGGDARVDPKVVAGTLSLSPKRPVKGKKAGVKLTLTADGLTIGKQPATNAAPADASPIVADAATNADAVASADESEAEWDDGTDDLAGAPVEFTAEATGDSQAEPSIESPEPATDDTGSATATLDAGDELGDAEITAEATVGGDQVTVVLPTTISGPTRLVYTWEQTITDWHRHFHTLVSTDPSNPDPDDPYDYDETPTDATPVVLTRTGSIDLDAATPTLTETVGDGSYSVHTVTPFGQSDSTSKILAPQNAATDYPLDRVRVDKEDGATTISGLRQVSDLNYRYDCTEVVQIDCGVASRLHFFDSWLTITPRRDVNVYKNGQLVGTRGGDGTSFLHAPDPDADLRIRKDSQGNWIPISFCGSGAFAFPDDQHPLYEISGGGHQATRFAATIVNGDREESVELPDCSNPAPPKAAFSSDADPGRIGTPVTFSDESVAASGVQSWQWDFGDKRTSTDPNPDHVYDSAGEYSVKLTVTDGMGRTSSVTHTIVVSSNPPTASIDDQTASASEHVVLHGRISSPSEFDRRSLQVAVSSSAIGFPAQTTRRLPAGPIDIDLGTLPVGSYPITMTVTDLQGQTVTATATIVVIAGAPQPPTDPGPVTLPPVDGCTTGVTVDGVVDELITGIDGIRREAHRLEVIASPTLQDAALRHATDLATHPDLVDVGSDGSILADRVLDAGYFEDAEVDELVLRGQRSAADALATWQTSTTSAEKLVDRRWNAIGAARVASGSSWVWVVVLGDTIDCAPDDGSGNGVRSAAADRAVATSLPDRPAGASAPAPHHGPEATEAPPKRTRRTSGARTSSSSGVATSLADFPSSPVPAFTIDNVAPTTGSPVAVHNRTRRSAIAQRGRFLSGDERTDARAIGSDSTLTTAWYVAGSPAPSIVSDELLDGQTEVSATLDLHVTGSTITPAVAYTGPTTAAQGATIRATATITDLATGQPLAGRPVTFTLGGGTADGTSDDAGEVVAELTIPDGQPLGDATLTTSAAAVGASPSASSTTTVDVFGNLLPVADAGGPYDALIGGDLILNGSGSSDPDATSPVSYGWDIGGHDAFDFDHDINPHILWSDQIEQAVCGGTCEADVAYPLALRVTDQYGASDIDRTTITFHRDFNLTINPPSTLLNPGAAVSYRVGVLTDNGFTDPVHLAVGSLPAGVTASFDNTDVRPGDSTVLTVRADQTVANGSAAIDVTGTAKGITRHVGGTLDLEFGLIPVCYSSIEGKVTDQETGAGLAGVQVGIAPLNQGAVYGGPTKDDGTFSFDKLPVGNANNPIPADISFFKDGYYLKTGARVTLACNLTAHADGELLQMQYATATGHVTVGTRDMTDPQSPVVSTGVPVAGARILASGGTVSGPSGADGAYRVQHIALGSGNAPTTLSVQADVDGYWRGSVRDVPVSAAGPNVGDITLMKACYGDAYVKAVDATTGAPIPGITLSYSTSALTPSGWRPEQLVTDDDGIVHLTNVPLGADNRPGSGSVRVEIPSGSPYQYPSTTVGLGLASCGSTGLAIVRLTKPLPVYTGDARVQVVDADSGAPIPGVPVNGSGTSLTTDAQGYVELDDISFGTPGATQANVSFLSNPSGWYYESIQMVLHRDELTEGVIRLHKIKTTTIEGTVTDSFTGAPIPKVQVQTAGLYTFTDDDGHYVIPGVELDRYNAPTDFGVTSSGDDDYWNLETATRVRATLAGPNIADLSLTRRCSPATIHGVVLNAVTREPLPQATVQSTLGRPVSTDENGRFRLTNQAYAYDRPGPVDITASKSGFIQATKRVTVFCGADIEIDFGVTTPTTTITGTVTNKKTGAPISGAFVGGGFGGSATTGPTGTYTLTDVPLGDGGASRSWTVTASPPTGAKLLPASKTGEVTSDGPNVFDLQLEEPEVSPIAAADDEYTVAAIAETFVAAGDGVLANDTGQGLSASVVTAPAHGTLTLTANGSFSYYPLGNRVGDETFTYKATDATSQTRTATVTLHVDAPTPPVAHDDAITMPQGGSYFEQDASKGLLANDVGDSTIRVISNTTPRTGQFSFFPDGRFIANPYYAYYGTYTIDYTIADRFDRRSTATLTITVVPTTDTGPPVVADDVGTTAFETALTVAAPGVLTNDTGMSVRVTDHTSPSHGDVTMAADGSYTYTPDAGFSGVDSWSYTVTDALSRTARGTVRVTVEAKPVDESLAIGDRVWTDIDADGIQDDGEPGVSGVAVQLLDQHGAQLASTSTAPDGSYGFDGLAPGDYGVRFTAPVGTRFTSAVAGTDREADSNPDSSGLVATFHLADGDPRLQPVVDGDPVTEAARIDRSIDAGLVALPAGLVVTETARPAGTGSPFTAVAQAPWGSAFEVHVVVVNTGQQPLDGVAVTDLDGAGCAHAVGTLASGASASYDCDGTTTPTEDRIARVHAVGTTPSEDEVEAVGSVSFQLTYSVGDRAWDDRDHDGLQDAGEPGLAGVTATLLDADGGPVASTTSASDGAYRFDGVRPGTYRIRFDRTGAYQWTITGAGSDAAVDSDAVAASPTAATAQTALVTIADGQAPAGSANPLELTRADLDAGLWRASSLSGTAFADADHDDIDDPGEVAIAGIEVELLDEQGDVVATTKTTASGVYAFGDLVPGTYRVRWTVPDGYAQPAASRSATVTGTSEAIRVGVAQAVTGVDIALWPVTTTPTTTTTTTATMPPSSTTTTTTPTSTSTSVAATATTTAAAAAPADASPPPSDGTLARTGQDSAPLAVWGSVLALAGGLLLLVSRRRRRLRRTPA